MPQFRLTPGDIEQLTVRNQNGNMIPLGTLVTVTPTVGPSLISLYNLYPSATLSACRRGLLVRRGDGADGGDRRPHAAAGRRL